MHIFQLKIFQLLSRLIQFKKTARIDRKNLPRELYFYELYKNIPKLSLCQKTWFDPIVHSQNLVINHLGASQKIPFPIFHQRLSRLGIKL